MITWRARVYKPRDTAHIAYQTNLVVRKRAAALTGIHGRRIQACRRGGQFKQRGVGPGPVPVRLVSHLTPNTCQRGWTTCAAKMGRQRSEWPASTNGSSPAGTPSSSTYLLYEGRPQPRPFDRTTGTITSFAHLMRRSSRVMQLTSHANQIAAVRNLWRTCLATFGRPPGNRFLRTHWVLEEG